MELGTNKQDITPAPPIYLAGFDHREGKATEIFEKLYLRSFLLKQSDDIFLLIVADLIWWDTAFVKRMKCNIEREYEIPKQQIVFHATHNHSGPQTSSRFSKQLGVVNKSYLLFLEEKIMESVKSLFLDLEEVKMVIGKGTSHIGINRRKKIDGVIEMAPNPKGVVDDELRVYSFLNDKGRAKGIWIHYTCHPTSTDENIISSEFTGLCCKKLEEKFPGCHVAFLQGFCGDIRPKQICDDEFYRGDLEDVVYFGEVLFNDVKNTLQSNKAKICHNSGPFVFAEKEIPLTFSDENIKDNIPDKLKDEWPKLIKDSHREYHLIFQYIRINDCLELLTCNAEMVSFYGFFVKNQNENVIPLGYSNGMIGYIPTSEQLNEGGYEVEESLFYFGYPNKVSNELENKIKVTIKELIRKECYHVKNDS